MKRLFPFEKSTCYIRIVIALLLFVTSCKKNDNLSKDVTIKSIELQINFVHYTMSDSGDSIIVLVPDGYIDKGYVINIELPENATSSPAKYETILFINGIAKLTVTAQDGITKKDYIIKVVYTTALITQLTLEINNTFYDAMFSNDTAKIVIPYDGSTVNVAQAKINSIVLTNAATSIPKNGENLIFTNNLSKINVVSQEGKTKKNYTVQCIFTNPIAKTYSGGAYFGMALRDTIIAYTDTIVTVSNMANITHSFTFGAKQGNKKAENGQLAFTKEDLGMPSDDGITLNLTTGGKNVPVVTNKMYEIRHWKDLQAMRVNTGGNYILMNDITISQPSLNQIQFRFTSFDPIGSEMMKFTGSFEGNHHVINNLYIDRFAHNNIGLFGYLANSSEIRNLGVIVFGINGNNNVGGIAGTNDGIVRNCFVEASKIFDGQITGSFYAGNLVGNNKNIISNCYSMVDMQHSFEQAGGLVGINTGTIFNCYSSGDVGGNAVIGGLVGINGGTVSNCVITTKKMTGLNLSDNGNKFGRIAGQNNKTLINNKANSNMVILGSKRVSNDPNSPDGEDIDILNLNQSFFENLGWDFNMIWIWDATMNLPKLRK